MRPAILVVFPFAAVLAACANTGANYVPVVDGPKSAAFNTDLADCQQLAAEQPTLNGNTAVNAAAGAGVAAASTAIINNRGNNVLDAAVVGALAGVTASAVQQNQYKSLIVRECMDNRGHNVIG